MSAPDLSPQITQGATDPASAAVDGMAVSAKPISELILADQYLAQKNASKQAHGGIRFTKLVGPPQHGGHHAGDPFWPWAGG